jgi:hypothetical protein
LNSQKLREKRAQTQKEPDEDGFVAAGASMPSHTRWRTPIS